jgi:aryl-alcohol dehydrogenase-like predicted oxidoreductase
MLESIDASLRQTRAGHIDLYQAHCWDQNTPIQETLSVFDDLVTSGKVRYIGCSNFAGWHIMKALGISDCNRWVRFASVQTQYSLMTRSPEWEIFPVCREHGVSINAWSPLAAGWLSGKYSRDHLPPEGSRMARVAGTKEAWEKILHADLNTQLPHPTAIQAEQAYQEQAQQHENERRWLIIDAVGAVAKTRGKTHSQVALAWLLAQPGVCSAVMGASKLTQLEDNLGSLGWALSDQEMAWLNKVSDPGLFYPHDFFQRYGVWR